MAKDITYYFKRCSKFDVSKLLPDISQSTIVAVENEVKAVVCSNESVTTSETTPAAANRRGAYLKISAKDKAVIGEYASKNGVAAAIRHFKKTERFLSKPNSWPHSWPAKKFRG